MYSIDQIIDGVKKPTRSYIELKRLYHENIAQAERINVMDQDWDILVVLDACRYDLFEETNDIEGELYSVISQGSHTWEFLEKNFGDNVYLDTVYVSANPQLQNQDKIDCFYACDRVWKDNWDEDLHTVRPSVVTDAAIATYERYPDKRLIVHYNQPHAPFIGDRGRDIPHPGFGRDPEDFNVDDESSVWDLLESGKISKDRVWEAYRENLELALPEVKRLIGSIPGKTVVTSDHGNAFGELGVYGHPGRHWLDTLIRVPWLEVPHKTRREIVRGDERVMSDDNENTSVKEHLADLGYRA